MGSGDRWKIAACLLPFLAVSTYEVTSDEDSSEAKIDSIFKDMMGLFLNLYKATANYIDGLDAMAPIGAVILLRKFFGEAIGSAGWQLYKGLDLRIDFPEVWETEPEYSEDEIMKYREYGILVVSKIFATSDYNRSFIKRKDRTVWVPRSELVSGEAIWSWAREAGIHYPHKQRFEGNESVILAIAAMYQPVIVLDGPYSLLESTSDYNNKKQVDNVDYLNIVSKAVHGEFQYRRNSDGGNAIAQYVGLQLLDKLPSRMMTYLILPSENDDIVDLEKQMNFIELWKIRSNVEVDWVNLTLPKNVKIDSAYNLVEPLKNMGFTDMFENTIVHYESPSEPNLIKIGAVFNQVKINLKWQILQRIKKLPNDYIVTKTFTANRAFLILSIWKDRYYQDKLLFMARYGWKPNVPNAETGIIV